MNFIQLSGEHFAAYGMPLSIARTFHDLDSIIYVSECQERLIGRSVSLEKLRKTDSPKLGRIRLIFSYFSINSSKENACQGQLEKRLRILCPLCL